MRLLQQTDAVCRCKYCECAGPLGDPAPGETSLELELWLLHPSYQRPFDRLGDDAAGIEELMGTDIARQGPYGDTSWNVGIDHRKEGEARS